MFYRLTRRAAREGVGVQFCTGFDEGLAMRDHRRFAGRLTWFPDWAMVVICWTPGFDEAGEEEASR